MDRPGRWTTSGLKMEQRPYWGRPPRHWEELQQHAAVQALVHDRSQFTVISSHLQNLWRWFIYLFLIVFFKRKAATVATLFELFPITLVTVVWASQDAALTFRSTHWFSKMVGRLRGSRLNLCFALSLSVERLSFCTSHTFFSSSGGFLFQNFLNPFFPLSLKCSYGQNFYCVWKTLQGQLQKIHILAFPAKKNKINGCSCLTIVRAGSFRGSLESGCPDMADFIIWKINFDWH